MAELTVAADGARGIDDRFSTVLQALGAELLQAVRTATSPCCRSVSAQVALSAHPPNREHNAGIGPLSFESREDLHHVGQAAGCPGCHHPAGHRCRLRPATAASSPDGLLIKVNHHGT